MPYHEYEYEDIYDLTPSPEPPVRFCGVTMSNKTKNKIIAGTTIVVGAILIITFVTLIVLLA